MLTDTVDDVGTGFANVLYVLLAAPLVDIEGRELTNSPVAAADVVQGIVDGLTAVTRSPHVTIDVRHATLEGLTATVDLVRPLMLHVVSVGETDRDDVFLIEDRHGGTTTLSLEAIERLMEHGPPCRLAVVASSYDEPLSGLLASSGVSHVIRLRAPAAQLGAWNAAFSRRLYASLMNRDSVRAAVSRAVDALSNDADGMSVRLLVDGNYVHDMPLPFEQVPGGPYINSGPPTNLRANQDPFVGRQREIHELNQQLVGPIRCLCITGFGGMGKTALADALGRWQQERRRYTAGVWFVPMRDVGSRTLAHERLSTAIDAPVLHGALRRGISASPLDALLILDDVDRLVLEDPDGFAELIKDLLGANGVRVVCTSRQIPSTVANPPYDLARMSNAAAASLFDLFAPANATTASNAAAAERVMEVLDGYPFAIKLAASYVSATRSTLDALREQLDLRADRVFGGRGRSSRATSLKIALDVSYDVLSEEARCAFQQLCFSPSGLHEQIARVAAGEKLVEDLEELRRFSMADVTLEEFGRRFSVPEPARLYGKDRTSIEVRNRTASQLLPVYEAYLATLLQQGRVDALARGGPMLRGLRNALALEQENVLELLQWGYENEEPTSNVSRTARTTADLVRLWALLDVRHPAANTCLAKAYEIANVASDIEAVALLRFAEGDVARRGPRPRDAVSFYAEAFRTFDEIVGDPGRAAGVSESLGHLFASERDLAQSVRFYEGAVTRYEQVHRPGDAALVLRAKALLYLALSKAADAVGAFGAAAQAHARDAQWVRAAEAAREAANLSWEVADWQASSHWYQRALEWRTKAVD